MRYTNPFLKKSASIDCLSTDTQLAELPAFPGAAIRPCHAPDDPVSSTAQAPHLLLLKRLYARGGTCQRLKIREQALKRLKEIQKACREQALKRLKEIQKACVEKAQVRPAYGVILRRAIQRYHQSLPQFTEPTEAQYEHQALMGAAQDD